MTSLSDAPFIELEQVESTNNYATGTIHAGMAQHGMAVFAHHQTKGKGQRYKQWHGEAGKNIALSLILQPTLTLSQSFLISMAIAVGTYRFIHKYAGDETKIKWPNDIYWRDRKTAGILIENIIQGSEWKWCITGVGVNINQTSFDAIGLKAVSLKQITGKEFEPLELAKELAGFLKEAFDQLLQNENEIKAAYRENLFRLDETVLFKKETRTFSAIVKDVTDQGQLIVQNGIEESFDVGEVEWMI